MAAKYACLALFLAALSASSVVDARTLSDIELIAPPPAFCKGLDCPKYTVLNTTATYEIREYKPCA